MGDVGVLLGRAPFFQSDAVPLCVWNSQDMMDGVRGCVFLYTSACAASHFLLKNRFEGRKQFLFSNFAIT